MAPLFRKPILHNYTDLTLLSSSHHYIRNHKRCIKLNPICQIGGKWAPLIFIKYIEHSEYVLLIQELKGLVGLKVAHDPHCHNILLCLDNFHDISVQTFNTLHSFFF